MISSDRFTLVYAASGMGLHIEAVSDAFYRLLGSNYHFVSTSGSDDPDAIHRSAESGKTYDKQYCVNAWKSERDRLRALNLINEADVVLYGGIDFEYVKERLIQKKLTFYSGERWFKKPFFLTSPKGWKDLRQTIVRYQNPNFYYLALGAYCANDARLIGVFKDKVFQFAYLVPVEHYDIEERLIGRRGDVVKIMWCARFIDWKHPELPVELAKMLLESGIKNFQITMVGDRTPMQVSIRKRVAKYGLKDFISLKGGLPNAEVRKMMAESDIFLITSDRKEGWGAVLNEAMGEGCAIVVSNEIGSCPVLIKDGKNGKIFQSRSVQSLFKSVKQLIDNVKMRECLAREAYHTITGIWAVDKAAQRFLSLSKSITNGHLQGYTEGPCSMAYPVDSRQLLAE